MSETADDAAAPAPEVPGQVETATAEQAATIAELNDHWRRAAADLDNMRKRYGRDLARERSAERARVATAWLPVLDNLELALDHAGSTESAVTTGLQAIREQAVQILAGLGYPRHADVDAPFDPTRQEVVSVVEDAAKPAGTVVAVVKPGYGEPGAQLLRPSAVVVTRAPEQTSSG